MMRLGFEEFERETMFGRIKKGLLIVWDVLFPPLEGDPESDDEINGVMTCQEAAQG